MSQVRVLPGRPKEEDMKIKTIEDLKYSYSNNKDHFDIVDILDNDSDLFELHAFIYRKATSLNDVYHTRDLNDVPAKTRKKLNLDIITTGANAEGMDFLEIGNDTSVAFESKRYEEQNTHKGVAHKEVANKKSVIQNTNIDKLIFVTNKTKASFRAEKYNPDVGYIFREEIFSRDAVNTVREYLKNHKQKEYFPLKPRDKFFEEAIEDCGLQITEYKDKKGRMKIFQHWPASTGKGSMPRLIYDSYIEPLWDFKKSFPINAIVNPNTAVLKTNLIKQVEHDLALKNNVRHIVFGEATKGANMEDLATLKHLCDIPRSEQEFIKLIKKYTNSTIWIHVTNSSYEKVGRFLKALKKSIYFQHIDEVHHNIQPIESSWRAPLDESVVKVKWSYMTSANIRIARGKGSVESMDDDDFADIYIKELDEQTAVKLGYKRQTRQLVYEYDHTAYPPEWQIEIEEGKLPNVKFDKVVVPLHWAEQLDANIRAYIEHDMNFMKYTFNRVDDIVDFEKIYQTLKEQILRSLARSGVISSNTKRYREILNRPFIVADTKSFKTSTILRKVEAIPDIYPEGADFGHVFLLGEGWDPKNGWVQGNCFMDPTHSELRIYQDVNRGARGPQYRKYNDLVVATHKETFEDEQSYRNRICETVISVGEKLQHGFEDIRDSVLFKAVRGTPKPGGAKVRGRDLETYYDQADTDVLTGAFDRYVAFGKHYYLFEKTNEILDYYQKEYEKRNLCFGVLVQNKKQDLEKEILVKFPESFETNKNKLLGLRKVLYGHSYKISPERKVQVFDWREAQEQLAESQKQQIRNVVETHVSKQFHPNTNFATYSKDVINLPFVDRSIFEGNKKKDIWDIVVLAFGGKTNFRTKEPGFSINILWEKYKNNFAKTKQKVAEAIVEFIQQKIDSNDFEKNLNELNGLTLVDRSSGTWKLTHESEIVKYVEQTTGVKGISPSTMTALLKGTKVERLKWMDEVLTSEQRQLLKDFNSKAMDLRKGTSWNLLQSGEILETPNGQYSDVFKALKENNVEMYSESVLRLGRYLSKEIKAGRFKVKRKEKCEA